jgi:pimeloyl-ACP methyl ester carboxylesterase
MPTIITPTLEVSFDREGPKDGLTIILLHGWPDDALAWRQVLPPLHAAGYATVTPNLRGYGATRFRHAETPRSAQVSALAQDVLELADALGIARFAVVGHDWGARAAYAAAALWPERVSHCVSMAVGWGNFGEPTQDLSLEQARNYWYQWYLGTPHGQYQLEQERRSFTRFLWESWGPSLDWFTDAEFEATAESFENPDWTTVVLHYYRHRWGIAEGDPRYDALEARLARTPSITVPTLLLQGGADECTVPTTTEGRQRFFSAPYERVVIPDVGHFLPREAPQAVARAITEFLGGWGDRL